MQNTETTASWVKYPGNPVLGGKYGTCFDISMLKRAIVPDVVFLGVRGQHSGPW